MLVTISCPPPKIELPRSVNAFGGGSALYTAMECIALLLNWVLCGQSFQYVLVHNFTNMHVMSRRSDFFAYGSTVNISEPAFSCTITKRSMLSRVRLHCILIPTAMSDSESLNTSFLEVMIFSKIDRFFIRDLSDLTLQIIFNAWWVSMNVHSKRSIAWNDCRHASWWRFDFHCGIEETGSLGIICIGCHQVLRHSSEHGTSSMGEHSLAWVQIAMLNKLTEPEVTEMTSSTVDETALVTLNRQGSRGITVVSSQRKLIFDI